MNRFNEGRDLRQSVSTFPHKDTSFQEELVHSFLSLYYDNHNVVPDFDTIQDHMEHIQLDKNVVEKEIQLWK